MKTPEPPGNWLGSAIAHHIPVEANWCKKEFSSGAFLKGTSPFVPAVPERKGIRKRCRMRCCRISLTSSMRRHRELQLRGGALSQRVTHHRRTPSAAGEWFSLARNVVPAHLEERQVMSFCSDLPVGRWHGVEVSQRIVDVKRSGAPEKKNVRRLVVLGTHAERRS